LAYIRKVADPAYEALVAAKRGRVANILGIHGIEPEVGRGHLALYMAVMFERFRPERRPCSMEKSAVSFEEGAVVVRGRASGFAQEIQVGDHRLTSDEPASAGGTDTGPTPYDLLLAALGA
jgi:putative redox protein